jgi:flagellar basal body-associated protein FliL
MGKILPVLLALIGLGAGGALGYVMRPPPPEPEIAEGEKSEKAPKDAEKEASKDKDEKSEKSGDDAAFVKINNQFVVPVVQGERVRALVVLSITLETTEDKTQTLYTREPKIRDAFLRVLFDHAYGGGFDGAFTASPNLDALRYAMLEAAQRVVGDIVKDVLITDIVRQDT